VNVDAVQVINQLHFSVKFSLRRLASSQLSVKRAQISELVFDLIKWHSMRQNGAPVPIEVV
jgi:hypothetical protein